MKPHKHAEFIKAAADGKPIEVFSKQLNKWLDVTSMSAFDSDCVFRMKDKEPVVRWLWVWKANSSRNPWELSQYLTEDEAKRMFNNRPIKKLEWSREEFDK